MLETNNILYDTLSTLELQNPSFRKTLIDFLFRELGEYRDPEKDIQACLDYILNPNKGGHVFVARGDDKKILGVVFLTNTKMSEFVPEYLLVYIATSSEHRGQGIGAYLIELARQTVKAPIALHVEHDNPAIKLYQKLGFSNKYQEMRWYPDGKAISLQQ